MRKLLLSLVTFFAVSAAQAAVGDDLTAKYLKNADFSQGTVVEGFVCTYDYDMPGKNAQLYGQQAVEGWDALNLTDNTLVSESSNNARTDGLNARAAGLFAIADPETTEARLGGENYFAPAERSTGATSGNVLGLVAVWGAKLQYTQNVTLPAGAYTIKFMTYNGAGTAVISANHFGFIDKEGKAYTCSQTVWDEVQVWAEQSVTFYLEEETEGVISVGYTGPGGSGSMPHLFIESVKIEEADATIILKAQVDELKENELLPLLEAGDELGVDTKAGWAVYNDDNATLEQVKQAIEKQKDANEKGMTDFTEYFINNAHFAEGTPLDAGVCTYDYDMENNSTVYYGMQPIKDWTANAPSTNTVESVNNGRASGLFAVGSPESVWLGSSGDVVPATKANGSTEGNLFGFISVWTAVSYYYQNATLPAGSYTITIPTYNERGTGAITKNLCGFVADDGTEYLAETKTFPVGEWSNETIKFALDEETSGQFRIGYEAANAGSGSMPHLFVDEFTLMYNGVLSNPSLLALSGAVRTADTYLNSDMKYEASIKERLATAANEGQSLVSAGSTDDAANVAAATAINAAIAEAVASAAAYETFKNFIEGKLAAAILKYSDGELSSLGEELADLRDEYYDAYDEGAYSPEKINEAIAALKPAIVEKVETAFAAAAADGQSHDLDISALFENVSFENRSIEGWTCERSAGKFESQQDGVLEVWHNSAVNNFTASTTKANLPAGAYEISAPAWYRSAGDAAEGYNQYVSEEVIGKSYIFANGNKTLLINQFDERLLSATEDAIHNANVGTEDDPVYVPNGQAQAQKLFYNSEINVTNTVTTALLEEGDLTFGFKGEGLEYGTWTVWGEMTVTYKGNGEDVMMASLNGELESLLADAATLANNEIVASVEASDNMLTTAINSGEAAQRSASIDEKKAAIVALKEAIEYASKSESLIYQLMDVFNTYAGLLGDSDLDSNDETLSTLLDDEIGDPENGAKSNEQIEQWMKDIPVAWTKFVCGQPGMATATETTPVDVTAAILNADFEGIDSQTPGASYWSATRDGGNEGYEYGIYEFYNNNSFDIHQTIIGLPAGCYRVKVQAFYRAGDNAVNVKSMTEDAENINHAYLYANKNAVALQNVLDLEDTEEYTAGEAFNVEGEVTVDYKGNSEFTIPNNRNSLAYYFEAGCYWNQLDVMVADGMLTLGISKQEHVGSDWCPYDNFQLLYLGTKAPDAIESINANTTATKAIFDLQGRRVNKAQKGLYIMEGRVVMVK